MSVHGPKSLSPVQWPAEQLAPVPAALTQLQQWAQDKPLDNALRHRCDGQWYAWRWIDVLRDVECLADELRQQGFAGQSRLALCGAFEPHMALLALAAQSVGGQVVTLTDELEPGRLHQQLWRIRPTHAYMPGVWLTGGQGAVFPCLLERRDPAPRRVHWWQALDKSPLWSVEGTGWQGGLAVLLRQWLESGQSLAFVQPSETSVEQAWRFSWGRMRHRAGRLGARYWILAVGVISICLNIKGVFHE